MQISVILVWLVGVLSRSTGAPAGDGSQCPNVSCSPPIPGAQCNPKYERDDGCCPVWYCYQNGAVSTIYGMSTGGSSSSSSGSSWSSSSSYGNGMSSSSSYGNGVSGGGGTQQWGGGGGGGMQQWGGGGGGTQQWGGGGGGGGNAGGFPGFQIQLPNLGNLFGG